LPGNLEIDQQLYRLYLSFIVIVRLNNRLSE